MKGLSLKHLLIEAYITGVRTQTSMVGEKYIELREIADAWADKRLREFVSNCMQDLDL